MPDARSGWRGYRTLFEPGAILTIVDIATFPWVRNLVGLYDAADLIRLGEYPHVVRALDAFVARPAVKRGLEIPRRACSGAGGTIVAYAEILPPSSKAKLPVWRARKYARRHRA